MHIAEQELPLNSARDAVRFHVTITCAAIVADSPVATVDSRSLWQPHSSLQRHGGEEQGHGHAAMDGSDGGAVKTRLEL